MVTNHLAAGLAALGLLSACSQSMGAAPSTAAMSAPTEAAPSTPSPAAAPGGAGAFDGTYRASAPVSSGTCATTFSPVIRIRGGVVTHVFNPSVRYSGRVGPDGSVDLQYDPTHVLSGRFSDGRFDGYASSGRCQYHYLLTRQ